MKRRYLLDTNAVSDIVKNRSVAARLRFSRQRVNESICISAITEGELLYGIAKKPMAAASRSALELFLRHIEVLPWRHEEALQYGTLRAAQEAKGRRLEPMDMLIAAHAVVTQSILVSRDAAFQHVDDLFGLENWATDL